MTPEERQRIYDLAKSIIAEQDPAKFTSLVQELNDLLESKVDRLTVENRDDGGRLQKHARVRPA